MASPYLLSNTDLAFLVQAAAQSFSIYLAFLNPVAVTTTWSELSQDAQGNWQPPPNFDTAAQRTAPYQPTCNMGSNRIAFVGEPLYFDGTRSCQRYDLPVTSYTWTAPGASSVQQYANGSQIGVMWNAPGIYTVSLRVTDRAGTPTTAHRQVMVYQDRESALPGMMTLSGPQGSLSSGGWQCQVNTVASQFTLFPPDVLPVGTYQPVVILAETSWEILPEYWVNRTVGPNGNFNPGAPYEDPRILFDGYVQTGSVHQDVDKDTLSFTCVGPQVILQEAKTHLVGYYYADYAATHNGVPLACKASPWGKGFLVGGLATNDVILSMLQYHSTIALYHDIHVWNSCIPTNPYQTGNPNPSYGMTYSTLSITEGTVWQNLQDLAGNEWSQVYCERDGSIRIGPQINFRGAEFWAQPNLLGPKQALSFINFLQDLGYTLGDTLDSIPGSIPVLPALPMPVRFVHPWGPRGTHQPYDQPFQQTIDPTVLARQQAAQGPPLICVFSDTPTNDPDPIVPHVPLWPSLFKNWPQDLSVYPLSFDVQENYTGRAALVKLIGTLAAAQSTMTSWYPQNAFALSGDGSSSIVASVLPAGNWVVDESHVLPDMTTKRNRALVTNWWWEMARRVLYAQNINYTATITLGITTYLTLGDICEVTRQNNVLGPSWLGKLFYVDGLSHSIDLASRVWQTSVTLTEVTSAALTPITHPPSRLPKA